MKSSVKHLDKALIDGILEMARSSHKKRAFYNYGEPGEYLQRMINAELADTYVRPHKHQHPIKIEIYLIVRGQASLLVFDDTGHIKETIKMDEAGPILMVEIPPGVWHSMVVTSDAAVFYEIIEGHYDPFTFKTFSDWAPEEDDEAGGMEYLQKLKQQLSQQPT